MFCSIATARRIEAAEVRMMRALGDAAVAQGTPGAFVEPCAGGVAVSGGPDSPITKVAGVGFDAGPDAFDFDALERRYARAGADAIFEIATLGDLEWVRVLEARGYRLQRTELVLGCALSASTAEARLPEGVAIDEADDLATWVRVSVEGFSASEAPDGRDTAAEVHTSDAIEQAAQLFGALSDARRFLVTRHGEPAGAASLRIDEDGIAQCCGATTLVAHRRRGIQTALLQHRLALAAIAGCDIAVVTTEPGSRSQANVHRHGFVPIYSRLVLSRPEP